MRRKKDSEKEKKQGEGTEKSKGKETMRGGEKRGKRKKQ